MPQFILGIGVLSRAGLRKPTKEQMKARPKVF